MELYRIILVDDEEEVRKSIIRKIDWEEAGFLWQEMRKTERMRWKDRGIGAGCSADRYPYAYMDGLTLAERIRQKYPSMKSLFFGV